MIGQSTHYIQAWKIFSNKSAKDISLSAYSITAILLLHLIIYAIVKKDKIIFYTELLALIGTSLIILGTILYGD